MKLLAIDASAEACSVALKVDGKLTDQFKLIPRQQTHYILPMIDSLLTQSQVTLADLDALIYIKGPGSFTGLRITLGVVQGLSMPYGLPVIGISSLRAMAFAAFKEQQALQTLVVLDARMQEVYWGYYQMIDEDMYGNDNLSDVMHIPTPEARSTLVGSVHYCKTLEERFSDKVDAIYEMESAQAKYAIMLGEMDYQRGLALPAENAPISYLRDGVMT